MRVIRVVKVVTYLMLLVSVATVGVAIISEMEPLRSTVLVCAWFVFLDAM